MIIILVSQIRISLIVTRQAIKLERNNHHRPNNDQQLSRLRSNQPQDKLHNEVLRLVKVSQAKNHQIVMNNIVSSYQSEILKQSCFKSHFTLKHQLSKKVKIIESKIEMISEERQPNGQPQP